eukprot:CAMPEP_0174258656 /NCGR_PEP_ID=MMETSP0439-20130205/7616_1 /TAXON_ID=0 /ORGANISM="Stereomyxa ramosa, Strain Chinc5" /LENGTH=156 /DNA_ID=CAMNT_0015342247 /DNA_START=37 /DNA_END=507 /DNA_ORIENTATION=+
MALQVVLQGFSVGRIRSKLFTKNFFSTHFPEIKSPAKGGYPDMGNGRYSQKLTHEQWLEFNNYQRAHYNYVEGAASIMTLELLAGLFYPKLSAIAGFVYVIGRALYAIGYRRNGPQGRLIGALLLDGGIVTLFGAAVYGGFTFAGGIPGLKRLLQF